MLTIAQLSALLNIKASTLYAWASQGKIPHVRIHGLIRFDPEEIENWLESFRSSPMPLNLPKSLGLAANSSIDSLIARAMEDVYNSQLGETKAKPSPKRKGG